MEKEIQFTKDYLDWVNDLRLDPPSYSPDEYAEHLRDKVAVATVIRIKNFMIANDLKPIAEWSKKDLTELEAIIRDTEKWIS